MPSPLEVLLDPLSLMLISIYLALIVIEALFPARNLPSVKGWKLKTFCTFIAYFYLATYLPMIWDGYLIDYQLIDLTYLNPYLGALVGLIVFNFVLYIWHRAMHKNRVLWRIFHQFHHSAERIDTLGAFYLSPADMIGFTFIGSISLVLLVGLSGEAVTLYLYVSMFLPIFQHMNVRTPTWLGYFIQRPESHSVHHKRGVHAYNYAELHIFDLLFGTFKNPTHFESEAGFYNGASSRIIDMLIGHDVSKPKRKAEKYEKSLV